MGSLKDREFKPDLTPEQMHALGVLGPQYYGQDAKTHNFFGINASLNEWPSDWRDDKAPMGWYQWYAGYSHGKRTDDDERQIKRWKSFKARHLGPLQKADPTLQDLSIQPRRRQALLNWGIAPGINVKDYDLPKVNKLTDRTLSNPPVPETPMKQKMKDQTKQASTRNKYLDLIEKEAEKQTDKYSKTRAAGRGLVSGAAGGYLGGLGASAGAALLTRRFGKSGGKVIPFRRPGKYTDMAFGAGAATGTVLGARSGYERSKRKQLDKD